jgi:hypothetical protein
VSRRYFVVRLICLALLISGVVSSSTSADPERIAIRGDQVLATVNPLLFGQNFGPWMNTSEKYVNSFYRDLRPTLLRFPAGNYGDENDLYPNNLDDLAALAQALGAEVSVQARSWRAGMPEKAAGLVRYCNVEKGYGFTYWEVGNEPDLYQNRINRRDDPVFDVDWYNSQFRAFVQAMKAVDPTIKVAGPVVTGGWREWMPAFIKANGDIIDVLSWHWYAHGREMSDAQALATPSQIEEQVRAMRGWWADAQVNPEGYARPMPPLFLSEYAVSWATNVRQHLGGQVAALWAAEVTGRLANVGVEMAAYFALQGTGWHGLIGMLEDPRPVYGVYQLYSRWGTTQVAVESSDEALLPAFASRREDGSLAVLVINKDPARARTATLAVEGFRPAGQAQVWLQDEAHPIPVATPSIAVDRTFGYTFAPYSVTLFILQPASPVWPQQALGAWPLWAGTGLAVVALVAAVLLAMRRKPGSARRSARAETLRAVSHAGRLLAFYVLLASITAACASAPAPAPVPPASTPQIRSVEASGLEVPRYSRLELAVALEASYDNPYDARQIDLTAIFTGPDGKEWQVPGFWDAESAWRVRFSPPLEGPWRYSVAVRDRIGESSPVAGTFTVRASDHHGWLQVGSWVDPAYSARYFVHHDGTPFYGVGHCNAFDLMSYGFDAEKGFALFDKMARAGENMLVYWPIYSNPFFNTRHDHYSLPDLKVIDLVVEDAARQGIYLVFTVWDHGLLRDRTHPWGDGLWETHNGFRQLGSLESFFSDREAWAWQENLYRYIIARWGYSPAIGLWQTVSEIEGTNAGPQADVWHQRVNRYFARHDPFRHPTTASMAGDQWWPAGYREMDVAQVHSYSSRDDPVGTGPLIAGWTQRMWQAAAKPNFVGEFGTPNQRNHPELLHTGIWAALAAGAAATPMEWNDSSTWGIMSDEMYAQMSHLAAFVSDMPLARLDPRPLALTVGPGLPTVGPGLLTGPLQAWGLAGDDWGFFWVQDVSLAGRPIDQVRAAVAVRSGVTVTVEGLQPGVYIVRPYDTWRGLYLAEGQATSEDGRLVVVLPDFERDVAVKLQRR